LFALSSFWLAARLAMNSATKITKKPTVERNAMVSNTGAWSP